MPFSVEKRPILYCPTAHLLNSKVPQLRRPQGNMGLSIPRGLTGPISLQDVTLPGGRRFPALPAGLGRRESATSPPLHVARPLGLRGWIDRGASGRAAGTRGPIGCASGRRGGSRTNGPRVGGGGLALAEGGREKRRPGLGGIENGV